MRKINYFILFLCLFLGAGLAMWAQAKNTKDQILSVPADDMLLVVSETTDTIPPADINLIVASSTVSTIILNWIAPGDDGTEGTAATYDLRYSTAVITNDNWSAATPYDGEPAPQIAGSAEAVTITDLTSATTYYFAIKTSDEVPNESGLSNVASGTTLEEPTPPDLTFKMNITPETLNLASQGRWMTVHIFLPQGYKAGDVDTSSVKLNNSLSPDPGYKGLNHYRRGDLAQGSSSGNLVLKFSRSAFQALVGSASGDFTVTVTGTVKGQAFSVSDTVYILNTSLQPEGSLVKSSEGDEVYIIKNSRKRHIPSPAAFERRGLKWKNIKTISQTELNSYPEDELIKPADQPAVYLIIAGMKRHLPSVEIFESYGFDWNDISVVDLAEVNDYSDVTLIKVPNDAKVYLLAGGKRHWIPSAAIFDSRGYKWDKIIIVNAAEKDATAEGEALE